MSGTRHVGGRVRIYLKKLLSDEWEEVGLLDPAEPEKIASVRLASTVDVSAGEVTHILLKQPYMMTYPATAKKDWHRYWVRVTYEPDGGDETAIWAGNVTDARDDEEEGAVVWICDSLEAQFERIDLHESYAEGAGTTGKHDNDVATRISTLRFNHYLERSGTTEGMRSDKRYHFGKDEHLLYDTGTAQDSAYVFGKDEPWSYLDLLEALLVWHCPVGGRPDMAGFEVNLGLSATAQDTYLPNNVESLDLTGQNLLGALNKLVLRAGPLMWMLQWQNCVWFTGDLPAEGALDYVTFYVQSRLYAEEEPGGGGVDVATTDAMPSVIRARMKDRVTKVVARGAPIKVMFSVPCYGASDHGWPFPANIWPRASEGWTAAQEAAWVAAKDSWDETADPALDGVFLRYVFNETATYESGTSLAHWWAPVMLMPDLAYAGARIDTGRVGGFNPGPMPILAHNLTNQGWTNPTANDGTAPAPPTGARSQEFDPILCWHVPVSVGEDTPAMRIENVTRLREAAGVQIKDKRIRLDEAPWLGDLGDWTDLLFTVSVETDNCLEAVAYAGEMEDEQRRTMVIEVPDAEWWAAAENTVISVDPATGTLSTIWGVLRNDYARLLDIAQKRMALLDQVAPRYQADIIHKRMSLDYELGDFVRYYGSYALKSPIATIKYELLEPEEWGVRLFTWKAWDPGDTP